MRVCAVQVRLCVLWFDSQVPHLWVLLAKMLEAKPEGICVCLKVSHAWLLLICAHYPHPHHRPPLLGATSQCLELIRSTQTFSLSSPFSTLCSCSGGNWTQHSVACFIYVLFHSFSVSCTIMTRIYCFLYTACFCISNTYAQTWPLPCSQNGQIN